MLLLCIQLKLDVVMLADVPVCCRDCCQMCMFLSFLLLSIGCHALAVFLHAVSHMSPLQWYMLVLQFIVALYLLCLLFVLLEHCSLTLMHCCIALQLQTCAAAVVVALQSCCRVVLLYYLTALCCCLALRYCYCLHCTAGAHLFCCIGLRQVAC